MLVLLPLAKRQLRKLPGDVADSMLDALEALVRDRVADITLQS